MRARLPLLALLFALACGGSAPQREAADEVPSTGGEEPAEAGDDVASATEPEPATTEPATTEAAADELAEGDPEPTESAPTASAELVPADPAAPLADEARAALDALPTERIPTPGEFYYRSNERRHDLLQPRLEGLGGAVVGVGSDQLYTLAAMSGARLIVPVDYDCRIPLVHAFYAAFVPPSETPEALVARFAPESEAESIALLEAAHEGAERERLVRLYRRLREEMHEYLQRVIRRVYGGRPASWLADAGYYEHVRALFRTGRVEARCGDVTASTTLRAVGETLQRLEVPVQVLYFSNAEQFFPYGEAFRANVAALPSAERAVVVRTFRHAELPNAEHDRWHYMLQDMDDFRARLETGAYGRMALFLEDLARAGAPWVGEGLSTMTRETPSVVLEWARRRRARD
ncbi:MAG TPA: hypothetical protein RMH85_25760 [Polyangiaceae bacterium LLY-WYZ-15_(1-7)]|nr:hypothetical protein [Myxococcales bacterium]MAT29457.1 hypothetical protein [Sandaracinus sp.]HJL01452.1 hypothetical protein [Polyangiaceae bacterium LLY-WYZ-15_(1-7)]HJL11909.1 hypothetical protein [Polyangiaceae bacterium LLY-WYZ-15_(1-7)]HJL23793.1 hypothetical protein [Polyangiaceae bacterium LLY-WYZ-15_(1-7)]